MEFEANGAVERVEVCGRHAEYIMAYFNSEQVEDSSILSKEIVFVDDVGRDEMIDQIIKQGTQHAIIG